MKCKIEAPNVLLNFVNVLYTSSTSKESSDQTKGFFDSVSDDVIYAVTKGQVNPFKALSHRFRHEEYYRQ